MRTITGNTKAWLAQHSGPGDLLKPADKAVGIMFYNKHNMTGQGWTYVGDATITVDIVDDKAIVENKIAALRGELQAVRAEAEIRAGDIELKIQKLLAIDYTPGAS